MLRATTEHNHGVASAGLGSLFEAAFKQSRNPMLLASERQRPVDVNGAFLRLLGYSRQQLVGHAADWWFVTPMRSPAEWGAALAEGRFAGNSTLRAAGGDQVGVQYAATTEMVTGRSLVLFVVLSTSRWGSHFRRTSAPAGRHARLSRREREVVGLVAMGETGPEIADELQISHETVRTHVRNAMDKLDARSRAHLVAKALGDGTVITEILSTTSSGVRPISSASR